MNPQKHRYPALDLLRLVAITLTMMAHARGIAEHVFFLRPIRGGLWLGVDLFMLISGWLLGGQLLREASSGTFDQIRFYVKRWLRTLPPYYFMLVVLFFFGAPHVGGVDGTEYVIDTTKSDFFGSSLSWQVIVTHLTFLQRYVPPNLYGVSWSLCVEEHFYLLLPFVVMLLARWPRALAIVLMVLGLQALAIVCRSLTFTDLSWSPQQSHMRCDGLFLGLALAWLKLNRPLLWARLGRATPWLGSIGVAGTLLVMASIPDVPSRWTYVGVPTAATWTLSLLLLAGVHDDSPLSRFNFPGLRYLGELTYAVYLVHNVLPRAWLGAHSGEAGLRGFVLRIALVGVCSVLLHHVVERPALRLRDSLLRTWRVPLPAARSQESRSMP